MHGQVIRYGRSIPHYVSDEFLPSLSMHGSLLTNLWHDRYKQADLRTSIGSNPANKKMNRLVTQSGKASLGSAGILAKTIRLKPSSLHVISRMNSLRDLIG